MLVADSANGIGCVETIEEVEGVKKSSDLSSRRRECTALAVMGKNEPVERDVECASERGGEGVVGCRFFDAVACFK